MRLEWRHRGVNLEPGAVMGIVNVTPDSFSDGGRHATERGALEHARRLAAEGAAILDVGGESTRPGAPGVPEHEELERVVPVVRAIRRDGIDALISVDTRKAVVAREALRAGADLVNDVTALRDPAMRDACADAGCPAVLMHMRGDPLTMRYSAELHPFHDVVAEVRDELRDAARDALAAGVPSVILDPGFGFGKSLEQNLELLRRLDVLKALGHPVLVGASRKSTLGRIAGVPDPADRDAASVAAHLFALSRGADVLRVHAVAAHVQAVRVWRALEND